MSNTEIEEAKELIAELCAGLYNQGHVSGTGGGISIKVGDRIVMAPSGVQKERMRPADMFVLDTNGEILHTPPARPPPYKPPKLSECSPLFMSAYELRNAGAVLHGHSINAVLATLLHPEANEFCVTHLEMIKGLAGHGFYSNLVIPIIENTARECELTDRLREAMNKYPTSNAVLVRRHGVYVWGDSWIAAKTQFECYEYLFEAAVRMHQLGIDARAPPAPPALPGGIALGKTAADAALSNGEAHAAANGGAEVAPPCKRARLDAPNAPSFVVLDIEGTVAPISFVAEVLFPYARARLQSHLEATFASAETQADVQLLREQAQADGRAFPAASASAEEIIAAAVASCEAQMDSDRKTTALKALQGHIWREGFASGELRCDLFRDVPDALAEWRLRGIKTYIYSSGSRQAQRDLFAHTTVGDLRPYLSGYFDTTFGAKVERASYENIALSLGADSPADILFATDSVAEARAAGAAGWRVLVADRPGNTPLPKGLEFEIVSSLAKVC